MKKRLILLAFTLLTVITMHAAKAISLPLEFKQPDGTMLTVMLWGDEDFHYYTATDGTLLVVVDDVFYVASIDEKGKLAPSSHIAHQPATRSQEEQQIAQAQMRDLFYQEINSNAANKRKKEPIAEGEKTSSSAELHPYFAHTGKPKAVVILCEFSDVKFTLPDPKKSFDQFFNSMEPLQNLGNAENQNYGSVKKYFSDMSFGAFEPEFEVVGPISIPQTLSTYGGTSSSTHTDENPRALVELAVSMTTDLVDYSSSEYDADGDGHVDLVYIVQAGYGQNSGGPGNTLWARTGSHYTSVGDVNLCWFSIASELNLNEAYWQNRNVDPQINGVGVFCHEFSHAMGLPDIYPTVSSAYVNNQEMEYWDLMDGGEYTRNGYAPTSYTAWERESMGWMDVELLDENQQALVIEPVNNGGKAYRFTNDADQTEYMMIENIQKEGWNAYIPGHGLMVYHVKWPSTTVSSNQHPNNTAGKPGFAIVPADGLLVSSYLSGSGKTYTSQEYLNHHNGDLFPGTSNVTELTYAQELPNYTWYTDGPEVNKALKNISEDTETGKVSFDYIDDTKSGIRGVTTTTDESKQRIYTIDGRIVNSAPADLPSGIYVINNKKVLVK